MSTANSSTLGSQLFEGDTGRPYSAFIGRDRYYTEMAELVIAEMVQTHRMPIRSVLEIGSGTGASTAVILSRTKAVVLVTEPNITMRHILEMNLMGDPRVKVHAMKAELLNPDEVGQHDAVVCCQMFHFLRDTLDTSLKAINSCLRTGGTLSFDLGPSNYLNSVYKLHDFRSESEPEPGEIVTELSHPLYRIAHRSAYAFVRKNHPDFVRENLWAPKAKAFSLADLKSVLEKNGFEIVRVNETLVPIVGSRIIDFIRNSWTTWCRWEPLDKLPIEKKLEIVNAGISKAFEAKEEFQGITAYHPSVIFTARKL